MATKVVTGLLESIGRQLRQKGGYPFDLDDLQKHLQAAIEGRFVKHPLFKLVGTVTVNVSPTAKQFVARDKFVVDMSGKAELPTLLDFRWIFPKGFIL